MKVELYSINVLGLKKIGMNYIKQIIKIIYHFQNNKNHNINIYLFRSINFILSIQTNMKNKKSINAKDFILEHQNTLKGSMESKQGIQKNHAFLSKIYNKIQKNKQSNRYASLNSHTIDCHFDCTYLNNSTHLINEKNDKSQIQNIQKEQQMEEHNKQQEILEKKDDKGEQKVLRKNNKKQKQLYQSAKMTSFYSDFANVKIFDEDNTQFTEKNTIFNRSKASVMKQAEKLNPFKLAVKKKNIKMIQLKINSLGAMADKSQKNIFQQIADGFQNEKNKMSKLQKGREKDQKESKLIHYQDRQNLQQAKLKGKKSNIWQKYSRERKISQHKLDNPYSEDNFIILPFLEPQSKSVTLNYIERGKKKNQEEIKN